MDFWILPLRCDNRPATWSLRWAVQQGGQVLSHDCILEQIGHGGMGVVWKALDTGLCREVALKTLPHSACQDVERTSLFQREAKALAAINRPGMVTIHPVERCEGRGHMKFPE